MYSRCNALYAAYVEEDYGSALTLINKATLDFPRDKKYALAVKFEIALLFSKTDTMQEAIKELEAEGSNSNTVVICKSKLLATQNKIDEAVEYFLKNISFFTEESKKTFCERLRARHT